MDVVNRVVIGVRAQKLAFIVKKKKRIISEKNGFPESENLDLGSPLDFRSLASP